MIAARTAKLAFLTCPAQGVFLLNLRVEGEDFYRLEISEAQLANIVVDGAGMALRPMGNTKRPQLHEFSKESPTCNSAT